MLVTTLLIIFFIVLILSMTALIVYFSIRYAKRENSQYEQFAKEHSYYFDKAQGQLSYRENSKSSQNGMLSNLKLSTNPFVEKYANYTTYPFGRGTDIKVAYVVSGIYENVKFRAFTYSFTGSLVENSGKGGVFSIVMIQCDKQPAHLLPSQTFFEKNTLCQYLQGNLEVDTIHEGLEQLIELKNSYISG